MKILIVEDDADTAGFIRDALSARGDTVDLARDGRDGLVQAMAGQHDVIIIDRMLPEMDGIMLVKAVRATDLSTPILFLTALAGVDHRVEGLGAGGDDYLIKPFAIAELLARVDALARRADRERREDNATLRIADLEVDPLRRSVTRGGTQVTLLNQEFKLLEFLMRHQGQIVTRTMLLEGIWAFISIPRPTSWKHT